MSIIQVLAFNFFPACSAQFPNRGATLTNASLDRLSGTRRAIPTGLSIPVTSRALRGVAAKGKAGGKRALESQQITPEGESDLMLIRKWWKFALFRDKGQEITWNSIRSRQKD